MLLFLFFSDDVSLEGLQQELEECKNDDVSSVFASKMSVGAATSYFLVVSVISLQ